MFTFGYKAHALDIAVRETADRLAQHQLRTPLGIGRWVPGQRAREAPLAQAPVLVCQQAPRHNLRPDPERGIGPQERCPDNGTLVVGAPSTPGSDYPLVSVPARLDFILRDSSG